MPSPPKKKATLNPEEESFAVSFTSLSMIVLTFFIFLNSMANPDTIREREVLGSLSEFFVRGPDPDSQTIPEDSSSLDMPIPELAIGFPKMSFSTKYHGIADAATKGSLQVEQEEDSFIITVPGEQLYSSGDDQIRASFTGVLDGIAEQVKRYSLALEIEGHTDNNPISTARFASNWELSMARSVSVLRYFLDRGLPAKHLSASGRSEYHPIADNDFAEGRAKNRRIMLIVKERESAPKRTISAFETYEQNKSEDTSSTEDSRNNTDNAENIENLDPADSVDSEEVVTLIIEDTDEIDDSEFPSYAPLRAPYLENQGLQEQGGQ